MESKFWKMEKGYDGSHNVVMVLGHSQCTHAFDTMGAAAWSWCWNTPSACMYLPGGLGSSLGRSQQHTLIHVGRILKRLKL